jgi:hypothetical protein
MKLQDRLVVDAGVCVPASRLAAVDDNLRAVVVVDHDIAHAAAAAADVADDVADDVDDDAE